MVATAAGQLNRHSNAIMLFEQLQPAAAGTPQTRNAAPHLQPGLARPSAPERTREEQEGLDPERHERVLKARKTSSHVKPWRSPSVLRLSIEDRKQA